MRAVAGPRRGGRRAFLRALLGAAAVRGSGVLVSAAVGSTGCRAVVTREQALRATVERVLVPDARAIAADTSALVRALQQLTAAADEPTLAAVRGAWRSAALAWQRGFAFQHGPFVATGALLRASFWPVRASAVAELVLGNAVIDAHAIELLGVDKKGLFALEHLLFEAAAPDETAPWVLGSQRTRALALAQALVENVQRHADHATTALGSGEQFARDFAAAGQKSVNRLVNQLLGTVETAVLRVRKVIAAQASGRAPAEVVQGAASGISTDVLHAWLAVAARSYGAANEPSLAALVRAVAPDIDAHAQPLFARALAGLADLKRPLEQAASSAPPQLMAAVTALTELETALHSELASALGVTITFASADGD